MLFLYLFFGCWLLAHLSTKSVLRLALRYSLVSAPESDRHVHKVPMPRLGGVGIFLAFTVGELLLLTFARHRIGVSFYSVLGMLGPATIVFLLGLYDDLVGISAYGKFAVQIVAAILLYVGGYRFSTAPNYIFQYNFGHLSALILTVGFVLFITNAFNLIDGLDGLAAGSALFATLAVMITGIMQGNALPILLMAGLSGALLGFLRFNFHPARIFLGDCGSLYLGFMLAATALGTMQKTTALAAVSLPVVAFGLPLVDTLMAIVRRFLRGVPLFSADREHIHHKLLDRGLSQRQVALILYGISAAFAFLSLFLLNPHGVILGVVLCALACVAWWALQKLGYQELRELSGAARRTIGQRRMIGQNLQLQSASEKLAAAQDWDELVALLTRTFEESDFDSFQIVADRSCITNALSRHLPKAAVQQAHGISIALDLIDGSGQHHGSLHLTKSYSGASAHFDFAVLTGQFAPALSSAIARLDRGDQQAPRVSIQKATAASSGF